MDEALIRRAKEAAALVFSRHPILAAYAYGSRVSGRPRPDSDFDVGCFLLPERAEHGMTVAEESALSVEFSQELGMDVDLRILDGASLEARGRVLEEGVRLYSGDDVLRVSLERATLSFYHDYKETFRRMHEVRLKAKAKKGSA